MSGGCVAFRRALIAGVSLVVATLASSYAAAAPARSAQELAEDFGTRIFVRSAELSPDGSKLVFVAPAQGRGTAAVTVDLATGAEVPVLAAAGDPMKLTGCGWSASDRIVCTLYGVSAANYAQRLSYVRLIAFDTNGEHQLSLSRNQGGMTADLGINQYDGNIIDWLSGDDGKVLMMRHFVPQRTTGTMLANTREGMGVERVDTRTNAAQSVEPPMRNADGFYADGNGAIRMVSISQSSGTGMMTGTGIFKYRLAGERGWRDFSTVVMEGSGFVPVAVDGAANVVYALQKTDGRDALYRVALDGSMKSELVYANPQVDVDGVETIGRHGHVIGVHYTTDGPHIVYVDPAYKALAEKLSRALPATPSIDFVSASADEKKLLIRAAGETTPGRYYLLDRVTNKMGSLMSARPRIDGMTLGTVKFITYPAADGTPIPAYLTLPPGSDGRNLPAIVMPHGGPSSRDYGGFDFLSQFFAMRGYAVIQPQFRGSAGFGDSWGSWLKNNAFTNWRRAIDDVNDAGRWMVKQGIADPSKLAIFGWSYGGYAALQSNVVDPSLFKAAIAVAPLTDFDLAKNEAQGLTNANLVAQQLGNEATARAGSPARHADAFEAPVLMFHGDNDLNVSIAESRAMDAALHRAGKQSRLVVYPGLDHQLDDSKVLADMLAQSDTFLRSTLGMKAQ